MLSEILVGAALIGRTGAADWQSPEEQNARNTTVISRSQAQRLAELERALDLHMAALREQEARQFDRIFMPDAPAINGYAPFSGMLTVVTLSPMTTDDEELVMIAVDAPSEAPASREQVTEAGSKLFTQGF